MASPFRESIQNLLDKVDGGVACVIMGFDGITLDAARACWLEDRVGSLGIGKRADIVLLRELGVDLGPAVDLHAAIVGSARGSNVDTVIVDGEIVKRDGMLVGIDRERIGTALAAARKRLLAKAAAPPVAG